MSLRRLGPEDWRAVRAVRLAGLREAPGNFFASMEQAQALPDRYWADLLAQETTALFGAFAGEDLVGLTGIFTDRDDPSGRTALLGMTYLAPAHRGSGVGHRFFAERLSWARERGFARVIVSRRASNEPSRRAIERAGFERTGARRHGWPDGGEEDDVQYELWLD